MFLGNRLVYLKIFLSCTILLDSFNGFLTMYIQGLPEYVVPAIRVVAIVIFVYWIFIINRKCFFYLFTVGIIWVVNIIIRCLMNNNMNVSSLFMEFVYVSRIFYFFSLLLLLLILSNDELINIRWMRDVIKNNSLSILLLILIPAFLGIGRQTYAGSGLGNSGFFIANNSTNIVLIVSSLFFLYLSLFEKKKKSILFFLILSMITLWVQGSKTSLLFVVLELFILIVFLMVNYFPKIKKMKKNKHIKILLICLSIIIIFNQQLIVFIMNIIDTINSLIIRQKYLANLNEGFFNVILSGRLTFLTNVLKMLDGKSAAFYITGFGVSNLPKDAIVEMDFVDLLIREGILGIIVTYGLTLFIIFYNFKSRINYCNFFIFINIILFIMIGYSIFAGHVYIDIMSSSFLAFFICMLTMSKEDDNISKNIHSQLYNTN